MADQVQPWGSPSEMPLSTAVRARACYYAAERAGFGYYAVRCAGFYAFAL